MVRLEQHDVIVVGAGIYGIAAAKTYLKVCPDVNLILLDQGSTIGGTWARDRLYPTLNTNNVCPDFEFSDYPISEHGAHLHQTISGSTVCNYVEYVARESGCAERTISNIKVSEAVETETGWKITAHQMLSGQLIDLNFTCKKLIIACGRTDQPAIPQFPGMDHFDRPNIPFKDLSNTTIREEVLGPDISNVTIIGAAKSGFDAVWLAAKAGKQVDWIIRPNGFGAAWLVNPVQQIGKWYIHKELLTGSRISSKLNPNPWQYLGVEHGKQSWFQKSWFGLFCMRMYIKLVEGLFLSEYSLKSHPERIPLKPTISPYWKGVSLAALNYDGDFWELISSGQVKIHRADVSSLGPDGMIHLTNGTSIQTGGLITCTGWRYKLPLAIPSLQNLAYSDGSNGVSADSNLIAEADKALLSRFPILKHRPNPPASPAGIPTSQPYQQNLVGIPYRGMVPISHVVSNKRNVVILGYVQASSAIWVAEIQALWAVAYLTSDISEACISTPSTKGEGGQEIDKSSTRKFHLNPEGLSESELEFQSLLEARWAEMRSPGSPTNVGLDITLDKLAYFDLLLHDLGLNIYRKKGKGWLGRLKEFVIPYTIQDYRGIVDEWMNR